MRKSIKNTKILVILSLTILFFLLNNGSNPKVEQVCRYPTASIHQISKHLKALMPLSLMRNL